MNNIMMNNNCQKYDYSMKSLLLSCNKPFHFNLFKEYTHKVPSKQLTFIKISEWEVLLFLKTDNFMVKAFKNFLMVKLF